jgi:CheY-like chemotaxis protein
MDEIVKWLLNIEYLAGSFYGEVSQVFREDRKISDFFRSLSEEEERHLRIIQTASAYLHVLEECIPFVMLDDATKEKIEDAFIKNRDFLRSGELTREGLLDCLATTEFSEWNDIFVYVVGCLKDADKEFMRAAAQIQYHTKTIEIFLGSLPEGRKYLHVIRCLPPVWNEKILIVEGEDAALVFLKSIFKHEGVIDTARNGGEALEKVKVNYYDVIIADIGMPGMNATDFYRRAGENEPDIGRRILFISGRPTDEHIAFFRQNNLRYLIRPIPIRAIKKCVDEIVRAPSNTKS